MSAIDSPDILSRVLVLAPTVRDADITRSLLANAGLTCKVCPTLADLTLEFTQGAGAVLLTEEALSAPGIEQFVNAIDDQPPWSDLPVLILIRAGASMAITTEAIEALRNITVLERPTAMRSLVSAIQVAVRSRQRQYQIRDAIDEVRRSEAAVRSSEAHARELQERLTIAIDASELGVFHCPIPLGAIVWNDRCKAHFWLPPDAEVTFDLFYELLHPDDRERTRRAISDCIERNIEYDIEYRTISPAGEIRWIRAMGRTYYTSDNTPLRFDGTTQDITQRKLQEREREMLLESERAARTEAERANRIKDEFLATVSHELRTPLNAILGWAQILSRVPDDSNEVRSGVEIIERNARLQAQLIEDLLDMSRIISGKIRLDVQVLDPSAVVEAALTSIQPAADAKNISVRKILDSTSSIVVDPGRLQQILWNLLSNAVKFTGRGGKVMVTLRRVRSHVELRVTDTGKGIKREFLPYVFDRFRQADSSTTRQFGGLGLGLAIVKQLVELHGGSIAVESPGEGMGASFIVELPIASVRPESEHPSPERLESLNPLLSQELANLEGVRALVVDDDADARRLVKRLLVECKADVITAASAREALEILPDARPNILISDIGMPEMDGYQFIHHVRSGHAKADVLPAVAVTAFARSEDRRRALLAGYQMHISKPVTPAELIAVVATLVRRPAAPQPSNTSAILPADK